MKIFNKKNYSIILSIILVSLIAYVSFEAYNYSIVYDTEMLKQAEDNKVKNYTDPSIKDVVRFGFGKFNDYVLNRSETKEEKRRSINTAKENKKMIQEHVKYYFILIVLLLLTYFFYEEDVFIIAVLTASLISWVVGILAPIMTIEVFKDLPIVGHTIFKYDSKSIWATIEKLWHIDMYFISVMVGLFSVIVPVIKTIALYVSVFYKKSLKVMDFIGKWSMADVFIVALLLANLSLNTDEYTDAKMQMALYFFSTYVILSIIASYVSRRHITKINEAK